MTRFETAASPDGMRFRCAPRHRGALALPSGAAQSPCVRQTLRRARCDFSVLCCLKLKTVKPLWPARTTGRERKPVQSKKKKKKGKTDFVFRAGPIGVTTTPTLQWIATHPVYANDFLFTLPWINWVALPTGRPRQHRA